MNRLISALLLFSGSICAQMLAMRTPTPPGDSLFTEGWSSGNLSCVAFAGTTCQHRWNAGTGGMPSLVATSGVMPGLSSAWTGSKVLAVSTTSGTASYIFTPLPAYIPQIGSGSATVDITFPIKVASAGSLNYTTGSLLGIGSSGTTLMGEVRIKGVTSGSRIYLTYTGGAGAAPEISANTTYFVTLHLAAGASASSLTIKTTAGANISGSPVAFTNGNTTNYANTLLVGSYAGFAAETYWIGNIVVRASGVGSQNNPPDAIINGQGVTPGAAVALADFTAPPSGNYCVGSGSGSAASGWTAGTPGHLTWDSTYAINPLSPVTVGGSQVFGVATPVNLKALFCGDAGGGCNPGSTGSVTCNFITTSPTLAIRAYVLTDTSVGGGAIFRSNNSSSDFTAVNLNYSSHNATATVESYNSGGTAQGNYLSMSPYTWYVFVNLFWTAHPHTLAVYSLGKTVNGSAAANWRASTAYSTGALVTDLNSPPHVQQVTSGGGGSSGSSLPSWNDAGGTTSDGALTWTDEGPAIATLVGISAGQSSPGATNPTLAQFGNVGAGSGVGQFDIANVTIDYSQGRTTTIANVPTTICANIKPGCPAASDLILGVGGTTATSVTYPFVTGDTNRILNVTGGTGCTVGAYTISSVTAGVATLNTSAGSLASVCSWAENTLTIGVMQP